MTNARPLFHALAGAALAAALATPAAHAQDQHPAVEARQSLMQLYAFHLSTLGGMAQEKIAYDAQTASIAAKNLAALAHMDISRLWPEGTDADSIEGTRALPDIWANLPDVAEKDMALAAAADAMANAAGQDLASLKGAMGALGGACGSCHESYRASESE